jgi:hypothetical protein
MSADRFETELRNLLRTEASNAPVQMSLADLRARSGKRSRWAWTAQPRAMQLALAGGGVAAVAIALALGLSRGQQPPDVGSSPSPSGPFTSADTSERPSTSPAANASVSPSPNLFAFPPSGSLVVSRVTGNVLSVVAIDPEGGERLLGTIDGLAGLAPDHRLEDDSVRAIGPRGDVLITLYPGNVDETGSANVLVPLGETIGVRRTLPAGEGTFAPDGSLVLVPAGGRSFVVVNGAEGVPVEFALPAALELGSRRPLLTADGSGVIATRGSADGLTFDQVVVGLDGTPRDLDPSEAPLLTTGAERVVGAAGQRLSQACDSGPISGACVLIVQGADQVPPAGTNIAPDNNCCASYAWTPGGDAVVMLATGGVVWGWDGAATTEVATLTADVTRASPQIIGFRGGTDPTAVLLESYLGITIQPLDGTLARTIPGQLLMVVP